MANSSEARWCAGRHNNAVCVPRVPEPVRQAAIEAVGVTCRQRLHLFADSNLEAALQDNAAFLGIVAQH